MPAQAFANDVILAARAAIAVAAALFAMALLDPPASAAAGEARHETTGSVGASLSDPASLGLTDEQRDRIFHQLLRFPDAVLVNGRRPRVAEKLPREELLQDLPTGVIREIPRLHAHKFLKLEDRILLVDPATRVVVAMIPRYKLVQ